MARQVRLRREPGQGGPEVPCPRPVLQAFLEVEIPPCAVRVVDGYDERARLGQAGRKPAKGADMAAEAVARQDHGKRPLCRAGALQHRSAAENGVLAERNRFAAAGRRIPDGAGHPAPVMRRRDGEAAKAGRFRRCGLDRQKQDCGPGQVLHRSSRTLIALGRR